MRIPRTLRAGVLIAAAVVLGLLTVQGTYALWNASTSTVPGSISSASFDVSLSASPSGQVTNMTLAGGQAGSLNLTQTATVSPGNSVYANVAIANGSNAGGTFNAALTVGQATLADVNSGVLAQYLTVSAKNVTSTAQCGTTTGYTVLTAAGLTSAAVPKSTSTVFCFQVSLSSTAPSTVKGQAVNITLPITARQLCGVPSGC